MAMEMSLNEHGDTAKPVRTLKATRQQLTEFTWRGSYHTYTQLWEFTHMYDIQLSCQPTGTSLT